LSHGAASPPCFQSREGTQMRSPGRHPMSHTGVPRTPAPVPARRPTGAVRRALAVAFSAALVGAAGPGGRPAFGTPGNAHPAAGVRPVVAKPALVSDPAAMVNTIVQTGIGDDFPGAQAPFGMIQWSPNTNNRSAGGNYDHGDNQLRGYALTN